MSGECTAYLAYILERYSQNDWPDYVAFLHDDAPRHIRPAFLNIAMQAIQRRTYDVGFLHLTHERYAATITPCFRTVYKMVFSEELGNRLLSSYCCSNFLVSKNRILGQTEEFYQRLSDLIFEGRYTNIGLNMTVGCELGRDRRGADRCVVTRPPPAEQPDEAPVVDVVAEKEKNEESDEQEDMDITMEQLRSASSHFCNVGKKPCYLMEFLWHVVFGEPHELPYREEDVRLPLALRYGGGRDTILPSPLRLSPYTLSVTPLRFSNMLAREAAAEEAEREQAEAEGGAVVGGDVVGDAAEQSPGMLGHSAASDAGNKREEL